MIPRVLAISPPRPGPWVAELAALRDAGVRGLVLRLVDEPQQLGPVLDVGLPSGLVVLVRPCGPDDVDVALAAGLGLHLPASWPAPPRHRPSLLGTSCHDRDQLARAAAWGCDYALISPVFPPGSKPDDRRPTLGLSGLARACSAAPLPVLALGGIGAPNAAACHAAGAHGVAGIGAFFAEGHVAADSAAAVVSALPAPPLS